MDIKIPASVPEDEYLDYLYTHHYEEYADKFWSGDWYSYGAKREIDEGECVTDLIMEDINDGVYDK